MPDSAFLVKVEPFLLLAGAAIIITIILVMVAVSLWPRHQFNKEYKKALYMLMDIEPVTHEYKLKSEQEFKQFQPNAVMQQLALSKTLNQDEKAIVKKLAQAKEAEQYLRSIPTDLIKQKYLDMKWRIWNHVKAEHIWDISGVLIVWSYQQGRKTIQQRKFYTKEDVSSFCNWARGVRRT